MAIGGSSRQLGGLVGRARIDPCRWLQPTRPSAIVFGALAYLSLGASIVAASDEEALLEAVKGGSVADVRAALSSGADVNAPDERGVLSIHHAAALHGPPVFEALVEAGADPDARVGNGITPFLVAASAGNLEIVELLIAYGADIHVTTDNGSTAMMAAAHEGHLDVLEILVDAGLDVNASTKDGWTALRIVAEDGSSSLIKFLAESGADVNTTMAGRDPILLLTAKTGDSETVKAVVKAGAYLEAKDESGNTALSAISSAGDRTIIDMLIEFGADVNSRNSHGQTPLMFAAMGNKRPNMEALIQAGAEINARDRKGETPLLYAAQNTGFGPLNQFDMVEALVDAGAVIEDRTFDPIRPTLLSVPLYRYLKEKAAEASANRLFVETAKLVREAADTDIVEERSRLLNEALAKLDEIVARYPESELAVRLVNEQPVEGITRSTLQATVNAKREERERCHTEPTPACVLDLTKRQFTAEQLATRLQQAMADKKKNIGLSSILFNLLAVHVAAVTHRPNSEFVGLMTEAEAAVGKLTTRDAAVQALIAVLDGIRGLERAKAGDALGAEATFARARRKLARTPMPTEMKALISIQLAVDQARAGLVPAARQVLEDIAELDLEGKPAAGLLRLYGTMSIAAALADSGRQDEAIELYASVMKQIEEVDDALVRWGLLVLLAQALVEPDAPILPSPLVFGGLVGVGLGAEATFALGGSILAVPK